MIDKQLKKIEDVPRVFGPETKVVPAGGIVHSGLNAVAWVKDTIATSSNMKLFMRSGTIANDIKNEMIMQSPSWRCFG